LLDCLQSALETVDAERCVMRQLETEPLAGEWHVIGIGKAAGSMTLGAARVFGERLQSALVITKSGYVPLELAGHPRVRVVESSHPVPDARSLRAGAALLDYVRELPHRANVLCLVSGGASSLVESPVPGVTLDQLQAFNEWALSSGLAIEAINAARAALSELKGGGLARQLAPRRTLALMISDVPHDDPTVIGSGLLHAAPRARNAGPIVGPTLPAELRRLLNDAGPRAVARPAAVPVRIVASHHHARTAAAQRARALGFEVREHRTRFSGDAGLLARRFARCLLRRAPSSLDVWSGESTVQLPAAPGRGGRNQHLALSAALLLDGHPELSLLAAGTDGIDGNSEDAGAVVDGRTIERGAGLGLEARASLAAADSGSYLEACGALVHTGPTLTNVGDLVLACRNGRAS
jgi:hydroxypyruvate reductase